MKFSRYMLWNFLKMFLIVLMGAVLMFAVIDFVGNIKTWLARDMKDAGDYYLSYIPYMVYLITPVALFIAVLASIGNMARHLEMSAMQSSGQSPFKTLMPIFVFGILVSVGSYEMSEIILPDANHRRLEIMETNAQKKKNPRIKEKQDFTFIDSERASWFFKYYSGKSRNGRDVVLLVRQEGRLVERIDAKIVRWVDRQPVDSLALKRGERVPGCWQFDRGHHREFLKDGEVKARKLKNEMFCDKVNTHPDDLINERQLADEMSSKMVQQRIEVLKRSGEDTRAMETSLQFKRSAHWMNLIVLLIGAALCHRYKRSGGLSQKFGIGLLIVFSYYIVERIGLKMGENGALTPFWAAWVSHFIYGGVSSIMLYRSFRL